MFQAGVIIPAADPQICDICRHYGADVALNIRVEGQADEGPKNYVPEEFFAHQVCLRSLLSVARLEAKKRWQAQMADSERLAREKAEWAGLNQAYQERLDEVEAAFKERRKVIVQQGLPLWKE